MHIDLRLFLDGTLDVNDGALNERLPEAQAVRLKKAPYLGGELQFTAADQQPFILRDDLEALVPALCIFSLATLESGAPMKVNLFTAPAEMTITPYGDRLVIEADWGVRCEYPRADALAALEDCGNRWVRFLALNFPDDPAWEAKLAPLEVVLGDREDARRAAAPPTAFPELPDDYVPREDELEP